MVSDLVIHEILYHPKPLDKVMQGKYFVLMPISY